MKHWSKHVGILGVPHLVDQRKECHHLAKAEVLKGENHHHLLKCPWKWP
jgi:hypothetical protein